MNDYEFMLFKEKTFLLKSVFFLSFQDLLKCKLL